MPLIEPSQDDQDPDGDPKPLPPSKARRRRFPNLVGFGKSHAGLSRLRWPSLRTCRRRRPDDWDDPAGSPRVQVSHLLLGPRGSTESGRHR